MDRLIQNRWLTHTLFWLVVWVIAPITSGEGIEDAWEGLFFRGVALPSKILGCYFVVYFLIPRYFQKRRYLLGILYFIVGSTVLCVIYRFNNVHIAERFWGVPGPRESLWQMILDLDLTLWTYFFRLHLTTGIFIILKTFKDRMVQQREIEQLKSEKATAELNFLKAQIHPHFLFNTLNNLYALTLDKSDQAPEVVAKLSQMLDYMLYKGREDRVTLQDEIEHLQNFTDLEALRYGDRLQLEFETQVEDSFATIAPLMLISLVENAFKHGVSGATEKPKILIRLIQQAGQLYFEVQNTKPKVAQPDPSGYREGIGVNNVKRQLDLVYPDQYQWEVQTTEEDYHVQLTIPT